MKALLSRWVRRRPRANLAHWQVTVYNRVQCCCCHKALELLREYQRQYQFPIQTIDIDTDPLLVERYNTSVPVVAINGKVRFRGVVNPVLLERLVKAEAREG